MKYKHFKQALLFKVGSILNFRMWFRTNISEKFTFYVI